MKYLLKNNANFACLAAAIFSTFSCHKQSESSINKKSSFFLQGSTDTNKELTDKEKLEQQRLVLISEAEKIDAEIKDRYANLERERDRNLELKNQLLDKSARGCFADLKIESLEIIINGARAERKLIGKSDNIISSQGSPKILKLKLGPNILITNDESSNPLFPGSLVKTDFSELKVSDIEYLQIEKGGFHLENECSETEWNGDCYYTVYEEDRYQLDSIKIVVNGQTIYEKNILQSHFFERDRTMWKDDSFNTNQAWLTAMKIDNCSQQQ